MDYVSLAHVTQGAELCGKGSKTKSLLCLRLEIQKIQLILLKRKKRRRNDEGGEEIFKRCATH